MRTFPLAALLVGGVVGGALVTTALSAGPLPYLPHHVSDLLTVQDGPRGRGGPGMGMGGLPVMRMAREADTDRDGGLTQAEIDAYVEAKVAAGDANGDGTLTLEEYQTVWLSLMRPVMVDGFQDLDEDGDGSITSAERDARFGDVVANLDRNDDGKLTRADRPRGPHGKRGGRGGDRDEMGERGERAGDDTREERRRERAERRAAQDNGPAAGGPTEADGDVQEDMPADAPAPVN